MSKFIIIDIDGTLCPLVECVSFEEFHELDHLFFEPKLPIIKFIKYMVKKYDAQMIFLTARDQKLTKVTMQWLSKYFKLDSSLVILRDPNFKQSIPDYKTQTLKDLGILPKNTLFWIDDDIHNTWRGMAEGYTMVHPDFIEIIK